MQIEDEIEKGILPDPNAPVDEMGNPLPPAGEEGAGQAIEQGSGGEVPIEPTVDETQVEIPEPKGGKI